jgi:toxin YoeB
VEIDFVGKALDDIQYWKSSGNTSIQNKISRLLESMSKDPFTGIGKPEKLRHHLNGYWSRRIDLGHRIVYTIQDNRIKIISLRYHYE